MANAHLRPNPSGSVNWPFECGEDLNAGDPVYIYDDSGAKVKKVYSSLNLIDSEFRGYYHDCCMLDSTHVMAVYRDLDGSNYMYVICGEIQANNTISWGAATQVYAAYAYYLGIDRLGPNRFVVIGRGTGGQGAAWAGDVSGTTVTVGAQYGYTVGYGYDQSVCYLDTDLFVVGFRDAGMLNHGYCRIGSVDPVTNVITWGVAAEHGVSASYENWVCKPDPASAKFAVFYRRSVGTTKGICRSSTYTGTTVDHFAAESVVCDDPYYLRAESISTDKVAICFRDMADSNKGKINVGTFSGTTPTFDSADAVTFISTTMYYPALCKLADDEYQIAWMKYAAPYEGLTAKCTVSGTTTTKESDQCYEQGQAYYSSLAYVSDGKYFLLWYSYDDALSNYIVVDGDLNLLGYTSGLMQENGLLGEIKNIDLIGGISEQLSGMVAGEHMFIQCDASISNVRSDYHVGLALEATKMLIGKTE